MSIIGEVLQELFGMFLADAWLTTAVVILVAIVAGIVGLGIEPLLGGAVLLLGCLTILIETTRREARARPRR